MSTVTALAQDEVPTIDVEALADVLSGLRTEWLRPYRAFHGDLSHLAQTVPSGMMACQSSPFASLFDECGRDYQKWASALMAQHFGDCHPIEVTIQPGINVEIVAVDDGPRK